MSSVRQPLRPVAWRSAGGQGVSAPDRRRRAGQLVGLGVVVALLVTGFGLLLRGGTPSQAGPQLAPVAAPDRVVSPATSIPSATGVVPARCASRPGVPVRVTVDGKLADHTPVESHPLDNGSLYVPQDPKVASWLAYPDVGPGADHGSTVLTSHVNYAGVLGAFGDLTSYRAGQHISVTLADGRTLSYHVVTAASMGFATSDTALEITKSDLDHDPSLNARIFDFDGSWRDGGGLPCGRLVIVTCTGQVVHHNYLDNGFIFALPDQQPSAAGAAPTGAEARR